MTHDQSPFNYEEVVEIVDGSLSAFWPVVSCVDSRRSFLWGTERGPGLAEEILISIFAAVENHESTFPESNTGVSLPSSCLSTFQVGIVCVKCSENAPTEPVFRQHHFTPGEGCDFVVEDPLEFEILRIDNLATGLRVLKKLKDLTAQDRAALCDQSVHRQLKEPLLALHFVVDKRVQLLMDITEERDAETMKRVARPEYKTISVNRGMISLIEINANLIPAPTQEIESLLILTNALCHKSSENTEAWNASKAQSSIAQHFELATSSSFYSTLR